MPSGSFVAKNGYPCEFFGSDTSGEKTFEEFYTDIDVKDKKANQFILFVNQNGGVLSLGKRQRFFPELTDEEVAKLETIVSEGMKLGRG